MAWRETLGIALLQRFRRGVRPTPAGIAVAHHARAVLDQLERMRGDLDEYAHGLKGLVRLLSNTAALTEFLPDVIGAFLEDPPNIDVEVEERQSYEIVPAIAQGRADVGVVADAVDLGSLQSFPFRRRGSPRPTRRGQPGSYAGGAAGRALKVQRSVDS